MAQPANKTASVAADEYPVGSTIGRHRVTRSEPLDAIAARYYELEHERSGARHIHIASGDDNNAFAVAFLTIPQDSTGVAHILEHISLCGSRRFPVRDPFFSMIPRSLSTFMNAFTSYDWTAYPISTRNAKDYRNLIDVYLDCTFFPRLLESSFKQEGHRLEFEELDDSNSPLKIKGIVYNEMKGAMADPRAIMGRAVGRALYPDLTYANNSGGDPRAIPDLTYEELKAFHARHYHPSNALFYTYGNLPLGPTLALIEEQALGQFERSNQRFSIPDQTPFTQPVNATVPFPIDPSDDTSKKAETLVAWAGPFAGDSYSVLLAHVLEQVLLGNAASPLRKALLESGLGSALADGTGYHTDYRQTVIAAGLKDMSPDDTPKVQAIIEGVLRDLVKSGIDPEQVEAAIHGLELSSREVSNLGFPYGLKIFFDGALYPALQGGDPYRSLQFDQDLLRLQAERRNGRPLEEFIRTVLLENTHRATITLLPDQNLLQTLEDEEQERVDALAAKLTPPERDELVREATTLQAEQNDPGDPSVLPTLQLSDVPTSIEDVPVMLEQVRGATLALCPQPTNGLVYLDLIADSSNLTEREKDLLPVLAFVLPRMGGGDSDYLEMAARIDRRTGGVSASAGTRVQPTDLSAFTESFTLSGKALARDADEFVGIMADLTLAPRFDVKHLKNLIGQRRAGFEASVISNGHMFAHLQAASQLSGRERLRQRQGGLDHLQLLKELSALPEGGLSDLVDELHAMTTRLYQAAGLRVCLTAEDGDLRSLGEQVTRLLLTMPAYPSVNVTREGLSEPRAAGQARTTAVPVAYDARVTRTAPYTHADAPALMVLAQLVSSKFVHREVREKGGAYGGFAMSDPEAGLFTLVSYRDPNISRTFRVFSEAAEWVRSGAPDDEQIREAVLSACSSVDPLMSPDTKGRARFLNDSAGYSLAAREAFKARLLATTRSDLVRVSGYLDHPAAFAVIASDEKVREANVEMHDFFQVAAI